MTDYDKGWNSWYDMKKFGPMSRFTRHLIRNVLKDIAFTTVLDVGCGEGTLIRELFLSQKNIEPAGADISNNIIEKIRKEMSSVSFSVLDIQKERLDKTFDLVTAIDILEHLENDEHALSNIHKMCKKFFLLTTLQGRMRAFEKNVGHVRNYHKRDLIDKLHKAGFEPLKILEWGFPFYSPLYRDMCNLRPVENMTYGEYGFLKKIISTALYSLFFLNSTRRGDYLIFLCKKKE